MTRIARAVVFLMCMQVGPMISSSFGNAPPVISGDCGYLIVVPAGGTKQAYFTVSDPDSPADIHTWSVIHVIPEPAGSYVIYKDPYAENLAILEFSPASGTEDACQTFLFTVRVTDYAGAFDECNVEFNVIRSCPEWTIVASLNGDNDLEQFIIGDINEIEVNGPVIPYGFEIFAQVDRIGWNELYNYYRTFCSDEQAADSADFYDDSSNVNWTDTRVFHVRIPDSDMVNIESSLWFYPEPQERNMGDPDELVNFANFNLDFWKFNHCALFIGNHGSGWYKKGFDTKYSDADDPLLRGMSFDFTNLDYLGVSNGEWESAVSAISSHIGQKIDLIGFDACLMQMWEVMDITAPYADFMVGSEETETGGGWRYDVFLTALADNPSMSAESLGVEIVNAAVDWGNQWTQSSINLSQIAALTAAVDNLASELLIDIEDPAIDAVVQEIRSQQNEFSVNSHVDLYNLAASLNADSRLPVSLRVAAGNVMTAVNNAVDINRVDLSYSWAHGIAIYYPENPCDYDDAYDNLPVASKTLWDDFIRRSPGCGDLCFRPDPDGWRFANVDTNMWPQMSLDFPDWQLFVSAFGESQCYFDPPPGSVVYKPSAVEYWMSIREQWPGSCFGFAVSSFLFFSPFMEVSSEFSPNTQLHDVFVFEQDYKPRDLINKYQLHQYGANHRQYIESNYQSATPTQVLEGCQGMFNSSVRNDRVLAMINTSERIGHAVNPYRCENDTINPDEFRIYVYDSNHPDAEDKFVTIDTSARSWSYNGFSEPGWEGSSGLFLMEPVSEYLTNPILPTPAAEASGFVEFYISSADTVILECSEGIIGHFQDSLFNSLPAGHPIIPIAGETMQPIGYYLPTDSWTIQVSGISDSEFDLTVFSKDAVIEYSRSGVGESESEILLYPENDSALAIHNPGLSNKSYRFEIILAEPDSEVVCAIRDIAVSQGDSICYSITLESRLQMDNYGNAATYDIRIQIAGADTDTAFFHEGMALDSFSSQQIIPDWRLYNDSLTILIDSGMTGVYADTVLIDNQGEPYVCGDANGSGTVNLLDITFLINYLYKGGLPPDPVESGDANGSGSINLLDVTYLLNYLYKGGPEPKCP